MLQFFKAKHFINHIVFSFSIFCTIFLLTSCSHRPSASAADQKKLQDLCGANDLLQKYSCNINQIQAAATEGDPDAEYALGYLYYYGIGTTEDEASASAWMHKAAAQGQPLAIKAIALLNQAEFKHLGKVQAQRASSKPHLKVTKLKAMVHPPAKNGMWRSPVTSSPKLSANNIQQCDLRYGKTISSLESLSNSDANLYTLQLVASHSLSGVQDFIKSGALSSAKIFNVTRSNEPWHIVVYGVYKDAAAARSARTCLQQQGPVVMRSKYSTSWPKQLSDFIVSK